MTTAIKIAIDESACSAHGDCADLAPEVFRVDDIAVVVGDGPPELIRDAARACPAAAILLYDAETGEPIDP
jgi:ferredoxin